MVWSRRRDCVGVWVVEDVGIVGVLGDVAGHTDVNMVVEVIPVNGEANVEVARPVNGDLVFELEDSDKMLSMFASFIFDAEVIDDQTECNGAGRMREEAGGVGTLVIVVVG